MDEGEHPLVIPLASFAFTFTPHHISGTVGLELQLLDNLFYAYIT